jgi:putative DNA primase/helicase
MTDPMDIPDFLLRTPKKPNGNQPSIIVWELELDNYVVDGKWDEQRLGPLPGHDGCRAPADIVDRYIPRGQPIYGPEGPNGDIYGAVPSLEAKKTVDQAQADLDDVVQDKDSEAAITELARLSELTYQRRRIREAQELKLPVAVLDKMVRKRRAQAEEDAAALPHWKVAAWDRAVDGGELLTDIEKLFRRYIVMPTGAGEALALWTMHAWTMDAGDISPFMALVSPTKRCGKTNVLTILYYLTPRSELASNISPSALFRYIEDVRPTLLIDEADSFAKENEELRGILNSGHTRTGANVIRSVEVNGEHKPRRFSTWAPKAIATIRALADTLEDRSIVVMLQRKPPTATVARLRKRDGEEFEILRRKAARWAADNFDHLARPELDPAMPEVLNDRAADNWRPLLAIADLAGGDWPSRARDAACILSGDGHDSAVNVEILADIKAALGDHDAIFSADLVTKLAVDPERPWAEWNRGKPLTQKQLAGLLKPFGIISESIRTGDRTGKGYKRAVFEEAWERYLPGQNTPSSPEPPFETSQRHNADEIRTSGAFSSVTEGECDGSKNANLSYSRSGCDAVTDKTPPPGAASESDQGEIDPDGFWRTVL